MGKKMAKSTIIWGQQKAIALSSFSSAQMTQLDAVVRGLVGPKVKWDKVAAQRAINQAKADPKMKNAYVKVGVIAGSLVLRCKEKKFFGDIEIDAILIKNLPPKVASYKEEVKREQERQQRLAEVMNRKDESGDSLRTRILRAKDKALDLGIGPYAQERLKQKGLTPMDPAYHGEVLDHQKNRYGRFLGPLKKIWDDKASTQLSFSQWLDRVEERKTSVAGVTEALSVISHETAGPIVQEGGVAGGQVIYLDDETRKPYLARANKGTLAGGQIGGSGPFIFVIGPDNKIYAGSKARARSGVKGAFNHSSFFSGKPVKSAGTLTLTGGKITQVSNESGHYAPTQQMIAVAVRQFAGGDADWLNTVNVKIGSKVMTGAVLLGVDAQERNTGVYGKYSLGSISRVEAEATLRGAADGAWLVRQGSTNSLVVSARQGTGFVHREIKDIGSLGLLPKNKIVPGKLPTPVRDSTPEPEPVKPPSPRARPTSPEDTSVPAQLIEGLRRSPGYHGNLNRAGAEKLLEGKPEASWLLREGRGSVLAISYVKGSAIAHTLVDSRTAYARVDSHMRSHATVMVPA